MEAKKVFLGQNLKFLRRLKGDTQEALAQRLGIRRSKVTTYEGGMVEPGFEFLIQIARYFEVTIDDLLYTDLTQEVVQLVDDVEQVESRLTISEEVFERYVTATNNVTLTMDGFKELLTYKMEVQKNVDNPLIKDLKSLHHVVDTMLSVNWQLISDVHGVEEE